MLRTIDEYFLKQEEPFKSCLLFLRSHIHNYNRHITEAWKYGMPFYCYEKRMCCYLWVHKKYLQPYIGFVEGHRLNHPSLIPEKRARMKILLIDPAQDIPREMINLILDDMIKLYE